MIRALWSLGVVWTMVLQPAFAEEASQSNCSRLVPQLEMRDLPDYGFSFVVKDTANDKIINCGPMASSSDGESHFFGNPSQFLKEISTPEPYTCRATVLARKGDHLRLKIDTSLTGEIEQGDDVKSWTTQNYSTVKDLRIGNRIVVTTAGAPCQVSIKAHRMAELLNIRDVSEFASR
jgi:hypothetical protein